MTESLPQPEAPRINEAQEQALRRLCDGYKVAYAAEHYWHTFDLPADYVAGFIGGYEIQATRPTIYVGADGEGRISS